MPEVRPLPWTTIPAMLRDTAKRYADLEAIVDGEVVLTFAELEREVGRVARALRALHVGLGDRVAVWGSNGWRWLVAACGIWKRGAVIVPISTRWKPPEVAPLLERTEAKVLFADSEAAGAPLLEPLAAYCRGDGAGEPPGGLRSLEHVVAFDGTAAAHPGAIGWEPFLEAGERLPSPDPVAIAPAGLAEVLFTSGTTGAPKGVRLRGQQILQAYWDWSAIGGLHAGDRFLVIPPYSHGFGLNGGILGCLLRGATQVPLAVFDPARVLDLIERERISVISGPPTLFAALMDRVDFEPRRVASLRLAFVGAAAVPEPLIRRMHERMGIERICNAYGLIEGCVVSMTRAHDPPHVLATTVGRTVPGVEVRIVDPSGHSVAAGDRGEVWARSQGVMEGYWRDPEQSAAAVTRDGWLRTGDIGTLDAAGNLRIVDRLKDMYKCGGFSAYPAEIESQLLERAEIAQAAVIGLPDEHLGEVGCAFVVPASGRRIDEGALREWARENMASYKVPRRVHVVDALPLNANGKVDKNALRECSLPDRRGDPGRPR